MSEENEKNVIVIQDGNEKPKNGLTWGRYGHFIVHYRWWVIGFSVGGAALAFLLTQFYLSPRKTTLSVTVNYDNIALTKAEDGTYHYLDGSPFTYLSIVSDQTIQEAITKEKGSLDLTKIKENSALVITPVTDASGKETPLTYQITGKAAYLGGVNNGVKLISDLVTSVQERAYTIASEYQTSDYLSNLTSASEFEDTIKALSTQYTTVDNLYQSALSVFSGTIAPDGVSLDSRYDLFQSTYTESGTNVFVSLRNELRRNRYVNYQDGEESKWIEYYTKVGKNQIQNLKDIQSQITVLQARLNDLKSSGSSITDDSVGAEIVTISRSLQSLETQKSAIESDLEILGYTLNSVTNEYELHADDTSINGKIQHLTSPSTNNWRNECQSYATTLTSYVAKLTTDTDSAEQFYRSLYTKYKNRVYFPSTGVSASGGYNAWLGGFIGLVIGFLGSSLICSAVGMSKLHREEAKAKEEK